jgi:hypothetical protein
VTDVHETESHSWPDQAQLADAPVGSREHFIPIRKRTLVELILDDDSLTLAEHAELNSICQRLDALIHLRFHTVLDDLKESYASFNPDADTRHLRDLEPVEREEKMKAFFETFGQLIQHANYNRLEREEIEELSGTASDWGLRLDVDFTIFEKLEVYVRGDVIGRRTRREWRNWFRESEYDVPTHQRLIVCFHLCEHERLDDTCDAESIYIKMFKNIPKLDIDMLLPGTRPKITLFDQGKIWFPTLSGIVIGFMRFAKAISLIVSGTLWGILGFVAILGGTLGYGVKSFFGYLKTKDKYQNNLTRNLYFQNLDNNAGVIHRLLDEAESQEFREAILAYYLLWKGAPREGWTMQELDDAAEKYLYEKIEIDVDFEADDAVRKLLEIGLAHQRGEQLVAAPLSEALMRIEEGWEEEWTSRS